MDYEILDALALRDGRDYLLLVSVIILLVVVYALYRTLKATLVIEKQIQHFSTLTTNTFAKYLNSIENNTPITDIYTGNFGALSRLLDIYAVSTTDANGVITYINEKFSKLCGWSKSDVIGKTHKLFTSSSHNSEFWSDMWKTISTNKVWHGEIANKDINGNIYWVDTFIFPASLFTNSEGDHGYIALQTDVTKFKKENIELKNIVATTDEKLHKAEDLLLHSDKMSSLGAISAGIAHEINNPISFISNNMNKLGEYCLIFGESIKVMRKQIPDTDLETLLTQIESIKVNTNELNYITNDYPELIAETKDGIHRVMNIATDLKSFSHKGNDDFLSTDIHHCIDTALNLAKNELKYKAEIKKHYATGLPQTLCVESKISQVFLNLFINASHAIEKQGILTISTSFDKENIYITVQDNGHGMDAETQKNIFEPFYTTKPVGKGTGLGLSISHDIIVRHNGSISVKSEKGVGTEFLIRLPILSQAARAKAHA